VLGPRITGCPTVAQTEKESDLFIVAETDRQTDRVASLCKVTLGLAQCLSTERKQRVEFEVLKATSTKMACSAVCTAADVYRRFTGTVTITEAAMTSETPVNFCPAVQTKREPPSWTGARVCACHCVRAEGSCVTVLQAIPHITNRLANMNMSPGGLAPSKSAQQHADSCTVSRARVQYTATHSR
jgi:hypothetical protein